MDAETGELVLLFDGRCGLCNGLVRLILGRDPDGPLRFAPLEGEYSAGVVGRNPWLRGVETLVLVERMPGRVEERILTRSDAVFALARYLGGVWRLCGMARIVPRRVLDFLYDRIARNRHRFFERFAACPVYPAEVRARFLP